MSWGEKVLIFIGPLSWTLLLILLIVMVVASVPAIRTTPRPEDEVASHRAVPFWLRWGARHEAPRPSSGVGPPPKLTPEPVVARPAPPAWPGVDVNTVRWPVNPQGPAWRYASYPVPVPTPPPTAWDEFNLRRGVLLGDTPAAANWEDTGLIERVVEPVRAEVVSS